MEKLNLEGKGLAKINLAQVSGPRMGSEYPGHQCPSLLYSTRLHVHSRCVHGFRDEHVDFFFPLGMFPDTYLVQLYGCIPSDPHDLPPITETELN